MEEERAKLNGRLALTEPGGRNASRENLVLRDCRRVVSCKGRRSVARLSTLGPTYSPSWTDKKKILEPLLR